MAGVFFSSAKQTTRLEVKTENKNCNPTTLCFPSSAFALRHWFRFIGLVAVLLFTGVGNLQAQTPSNRFDDLRDHIVGSNSMTLAQLQNWALNFTCADWPDCRDVTTEADTLGDRFDDFLAAVELIELYEQVEGPLFTSAGQASFSNSWEGEMNFDRALARTIFTVYQAVFDAYDTDFVAQHAAGLVGIEFGSTQNFPGSVPSPTNPNAAYVVQIDGTLDAEFGSEGGYNNSAARRMTGAYLAPGTVGVVTVPNELVNAGFQIRVGGHSWDLWNKNNINRLHRVSNVFDITNNQVQIANPMGGNIYIEAPVGAEAGIVTVIFQNTIRAPFFSNRSFDKTTRAEWENIERHHPGAFTDIESEHSLFTVPSKWIDDLSYDDLLEIVEAHDANIRVASEYVGKNADRHKSILYTIVDTQIRANVFSIGYPQSNYGSFAQNTIRAPLTLDHALDSVLWHEHGHAELMTFFSGEAESWNHMLATAIGMENYGMTAQQAFAQSLAFGRELHTTDDALNSWVVMDEFINNSGMAFQQGSFRPRGHADYTEYVEMFGLEAMQNFNRRINIEMDGLDWDTDWDFGRTNHNANNRILRLSREAGVDVTPLFHLWGHRPSNSASLAAELAAEGLGESVQIYDRMIRARDSVPMSQEQWNAVDDVMRDFLNEGRGPWQELRTNYDLVRAQNAVDQIQTLIDLYFPNGRPADPEAPTPVGVVAFSEPNFEGVAWELTERLYTNEDLQNGPIGNNAISSFIIPQGYQVFVADDRTGSGQSATYTDSIADLGTLDNRASRVEVTFSLEGLQVIGESNSISLDDDWKTVTLEQNYTNPVVIAGIPSYVGTDPTTVRIRNVTSNSFEMQIDEWDYLNPFHAVEVVSYMVLEAGEYTLADGTTIVAANADGQTDQVETYDLGSAFEGLGTPVVFANVVTQNEASAVTTRLEVTSNSEFNVRLQEQESSNGAHLAESISYFAIEQRAGVTGGLHYDAGSFEADQGGRIAVFDDSVRLSSVSSFFASMQTFNGTDSTALRSTFINAAGANVFTEEERSRDNEINHAAETIGFFAINPGLIIGTTAEVLLGDVDLNGVVNFIDIPAFINRINSGQYQREADCNQDGVVNFLDIQFFIDILSAG